MQDAKSSIVIRKHIANGEAYISYKDNLAIIWASEEGHSKNGHIDIIRVLMEYGVR